MTDATDGGHAAFASILWSPPAAIGGGGSFDDLLGQVRYLVITPTAAATTCCGRCCMRYLAITPTTASGGVLPSYQRPKRYLVITPTAAGALPGAAALGQQENVT